MHTILRARSRCAPLTSYLTTDLRNTDIADTVAAPVPDFCVQSTQSPPRFNYPIKTTCSTRCCQFAQFGQLGIYMLRGITRAKSLGATVCHEIIVVEGTLYIANKFVHNEPTGHC